MNTFQPNVLIIDVRTPAEYDQGHIPGAVLCPLFSNNDRAEVGITYHKKGKLEAIKKGLDLVGPSLRRFVDFMESHGQLPGTKNICLVYCWRGGSRSSSVRWLLNFCKFNCHSLDGGYKRFRKFVLSLVGTPKHRSGKNGTKKYKKKLQKKKQSTVKKKKHKEKSDIQGKPQEIIYFEQGVAFISNLKWEAALKSFSQAIDTDHPNLLACYRRRGQCLQNLGRHSEAIVEFNKSLKDQENCPNVIFFFLLRAESLIAEGNFELANIDLCTVLNMDPKCKKSTTTITKFETGCTIPFDVSSGFWYGKFGP